jgi:hypothetical protein
MALNGIQGKPMGSPALKVLLQSDGKLYRAPITMAFQFGTNCSVLSRMSGSIQGPHVILRTFTASYFGACFFEVVLPGR